MATARDGWWSRSGSNRRPQACKARALPAELRPRTVVGLERLELSTPRLSSVCSNQLSYRPKQPFSLFKEQCCLASEVAGLLKPRGHVNGNFLNPARVGLAWGNGAPTLGRTPPARAPPVTPNPAAKPRCARQVPEFVRLGRRQSRTGG